ncbi:MAG: putative quinol monooxygenase [Sphingopyxis sp.]
MIVVTGAIEGSDATIDELLAICLDHVRRSRAEPGCISHDVHRHAEHVNRLVFVEQWADMAALKAHFAVPESGAFVRAMSALASGPPSIAIYDATAIPYALGSA